MTRSAWPLVRLSEVCLKVQKIDPIAAGRETVRYVDIGSVDGTTHRLAEVAWIAAAGAPSRARQLLAAGDTIFSTVRPYLEKIAYIDSSLAGEFASTGFCVLRPSERLHPRWLFHFMTSPSLLGQVLPHQRGVSYPAVLDKDVLSSCVPLPTIEEQRHIVDLLEDHLSRLDAGQEYLTAVARRCGQLAATMLRAAVGTFAEDVRLADLAIESGYGTSAKCVVGGPGPAVVRIPNLIAGRVDLTAEKRVASPDPLTPGLMLKSGDLLVVRTNGSRDLIGRSGVVQPGVVAAFASYLIRFRLDESRVRPQWVRLVFDAPSTRKVLESLAASSAGQYNLSLAKLGAVSVPLPSLSDQDRLLSRVDEDMAAITRLRRAAELARARQDSLGRSLLQAAFVGQLSTLRPRNQRLKVTVDV